MLIADSVTYSYWGQPRPAVNQAKLQLAPGSIVALVGPNGAGKTTLIHCLAGLFEPQAGTVSSDGGDIRADLRAHRARTGFLSEHYGLYSGLTARQSMEYAAQSRARAFPDLQSPSARSEAIEQVAEECNVADLLEMELDSLSRGQRQLLAIAEVEVSRPPLLLLDEPASGLDPDHREQLAERLGQAARERPGHPRVLAHPGGTGGVRHRPGGDAGRRNAAATERTVAGQSARRVPQGARTGAGREP